MRAVKPVLMTNNKVNFMMKKGIFLSLIFPLIIGCDTKIVLQNGDLLFTGIEIQIETNNISDAINSVTQTGKETNHTQLLP
jgi:hypothetical protein